MRSGRPEEPGSSQKSLSYALEAAGKFLGVKAKLALSSTGSSGFGADSRLQGDKDGWAWSPGMS